MKESLWGYWIVVLGISVVSVMVLLQNFTTTSEQDYYLVKSCLEAAMYDAVDYGYYKDTSVLKMNAEKFYENFLRRFAQSVNINKGYKVNFYDVYEIPPAASVSVTTSTDETNFGTMSGSTEESSVTNRLTGILFTNENYKPKTTTSGTPLVDNMPAAKGELFTGYNASPDNNWLAHYTKGTIDSCVPSNKELAIQDLFAKDGIINYDNNQFTIECGNHNKLSCCFTSSDKKVPYKYCYGKMEGNKCNGISRTIQIAGGNMKQGGYVR